MKKTTIKRGIALLLGCILAVSPFSTGTRIPMGITSQAAERTALVNATNLNVRSGPGTSHPAVVKLSLGASVTVLGEQTGTDGKLWYQIRFNSGGAAATGYVSAQYIRFPSAVSADGDFESYMNSQGFPESYKPGLRELHARYPQWRFTALQTNLDWNTVIQNESVIGRNLVGRENISSWKSTAPGAYDWDNGTWPGFDGSSWVQASEDIIRYYMDPRNFLNDKYIYQFMNQTYDSSLHTREGLQSMVTGTFLAGNAPGGGGASSAGGSTGQSSGGSTPPGSSAGPGTGPGASPGAETGAAPGQAPDSSGSAPISPVASISDHETVRVTSSMGPGSGGPSGFTSPGGSGTDSGNNGAVTDIGAATGSISYVDIIMNAAEQSGVSPYIIASMILQEQGSQGTGRSISGTVSGYQGYYNFFNIEAYQSGSMGAVERGLWYASQSGSYGRPWNSAEKSILGGSVYYGTNYVKRGQNTLYLKKFNVQGDNLYKHQYMTNVLAAAAEGMALAKIEALKTSSLEFTIPVYTNMPAEICAKPTTDGSPNNKLSGLGVEGFALTPTFNRDTESYDLIVDPSVASVNVAASALDGKAVISGTGAVDLQSGINDITISVKAENGSVRNYVVHVVRQQNGPVYSNTAGTGIPSGGSSPGGGSSGGPGSSSGGSGGGSAVSPPGSTDTSSSSGSQAPAGSGNGSNAPGSGNMNGFGSDSSGSVIARPDESQSSAGAVSSSYYETAAGTTAAQLAAALSAASGGSAKVLNGSGGEVSGLAGTGNQVQVYGADGTLTAKYEVVVKGDNTGDGKLDILDVLKAQRHILDMEAISGAAFRATDVNGNGAIDVLDVLLMKKDVLGTQKLN